MNPIKVVINNDLKTLGRVERSFQRVFLLTYPNTITAKRLMKKSTRIIIFSFNIIEEETLKSKLLVAKL